MRPNDLTESDLTCLQHGNCAFASKDMKKSQGEFALTSGIIRYNGVKTAFKKSRNFFFYTISQKYEISSQLPDYLRQMKRN